MSRCNRYIDESSHTDPCRLPQSQPQRKAAVFQSKILPRFQNSLFAHFAPAGILLGSAFPKPCLYGLRRLKIPQNNFSDFSKTVPLYPPPVFPLLVRGYHTQKGGLPTMKRYNTPHRSRVVKYARLKIPKNRVLLGADS